MTRVNARLDAELGRQLLLVRERTGQSTSEVLKASLRAYFASVGGEGSPRELLGGFVGCAKGPVSLSSNYKRELGRSLGKKHRR